MESAIETSLQAWSGVVDVTFTQTQAPRQRDSLDINFVSIDGAGGTLAQAYLPDDVNPARIAGDIQFDVAEAWEVGNGLGSAAFDLVQVAIHEIGHALGLEHSTDVNAVMAPTVSANDSSRGLNDDDVDAILALYASAEPMELPVEDPIGPDSPDPDVLETPEIEDDDADSLPAPETEPEADNPWYRTPRRFQTPQRGGFRNPRGFGRLNTFNPRTSVADSFRLHHIF